MGFFISSRVITHLTFQIPNNSLQSCFKMPSKLKIHCISMFVVSGCLSHSHRAKYGFFLHDTILVVWVMNCRKWISSMSLGNMATISNINLWRWSWAHAGTALVWSQKTERRVNHGDKHSHAKSQSEKWMSA